MDVPKPPSTDEVAASRKKKARIRLITVAVSVVVLGTAYWYFEHSFSLPFQQIASFEYAATDKLDENFSAPSPSIQQLSTSSGISNTLTVEGVITNTNKQRAENGDLPPLAENTTLDDIATLRLDDMFAKQYFAHVAPDGGSAQTVASSVGYSYLALGENLALGNFEGDHGLVVAWMNSPGHRANILDVHYDQIGVAVRQGTFHNQSVWIAVQVFGKPSSDCTSPDPGLESSINAQQAEISSTVAQLQQSKLEIEAIQPPSGSDYNEKVYEYNASVQQYNDLVAQTKTSIAQYDSAVAAFNTCLGS